MTHLAVKLQLARGQVQRDKQLARPPSFEQAGRVNPSLFEGASAASTNIPISGSPAEVDDQGRIRARGG